MKKVWKIILLLVLILVVLGVLLFVVSMVTGGSIESLMSHSDFLNYFENVIQQAANKLS